MSAATTNAIPHKLLAWEGVGLLVPQHWELGRHSGDHRQGFLRIDDASRVVIQARWWHSLRPLAINDTVRAHAQSVQRDKGGALPDITRRPALDRQAADGVTATVFELRGQSAGGAAVHEILAVCQNTAAARALLLRFIVDDGYPTSDQVATMLAGLRLQAETAARDFALLDMALQAPPHFQLAKAFLKTGVCYLEFQHKRQRLGVRRFSAANAVMEAFVPTGDDLERWCRHTFADDFYDLRYTVTSDRDTRGRLRLRLSGTPRPLAPIELRWLIPKHRRLPRRRDIIWDQSANKIYCIEISHPNAALEAQAAALADSLRMTLAPQPAAATADTPAAPPAATTAARQRQRALRARVIRSAKITTTTTPNGRVVINYTVERPRRLRLLRLLGGMEAGPAKYQRTIELDLIGTMIWNECATEKRVCELVASVMARFQISYREAELSITDYIRNLGSRGILAVALEN